jgi:hypothetical protein
MDEAVFAADWKRQPRDDISSNVEELFPDPAIEPIWTPPKREAVADALNALNAFLKTDAGRDQALAVYRALEDDALRILAGLPGNEKAFTQVTLDALDGADPRWTDRRGPDDVANYAPRGDVRAWQDTLDGRSTNRYLYRAVAVDAAQNRSTAGPCGTPVRLPNVVPPRAPVITQVLAGEQQITLKWASNRERDLAEYRVFRAPSKEAAADLRLMRQVAVVAADPDPATRPAAVSWTDAPVPGLRDFFYRVVAVDRVDAVDPRGGGGNVSTPSAVVKGRAIDTTPPDVPEWISAQRIADAQGPAVELKWQTSEFDVRCELQRRRSGGAWQSVAKALTAPDPTPMDFTYLDRDAPPGMTFEYRVLATDSAGSRATDYTVQLVTP